MRKKGKRHTKKGRGEGRQIREVRLELNTRSHNRVFAIYQLWLGRPWVGTHVILVLKPTNVERHNPRSTQSMTNQQKTFKNYVFLRTIFNFLHFLHTIFHVLTYFFRGLVGLGFNAIRRFQCHFYIFPTHPSLEIANTITIIMHHVVL